MKDYNINEETVAANLKSGGIYTRDDMRVLFNQSNLKTGSWRYFNNRLSRFVSYIYDPKEALYIINEIYSHPLPSVKDYKYDNLIKILLLNYLLQQKNNTAIFSRKKWWEQLNMVNPRYLTLTHKTSAFPPNITFPFGEPPKEMIQYNIQTFFRHSYTQINNIFMRALERLRQQSFIVYSNCFLIKEFNTTRIATDDETEIILAVRQRELERMGLPHLGCNPQLADRFYSRCAESLYALHHLSDDPNLQIFDCIKIIFTKEGMERQLERDKRKLEEAGLSLNELIQAWADSWARATGKPIKPRLITLCADTYIARVNADTSDN